MKWLLLLVPIVCFAQPVVIIDGEKSSLIVERVELRSGIHCDSGIYYWSESDPHYRGQLDAYCIDVKTGEGIHYDVCNGLGDYVAVVEWQAAGNQCYTEREYDDRCDGFSPLPPGCDAYSSKSRVQQ